VDNATPRFDLASSICCRFVNRFARPKVLSHVSRQRCSPREAHLPSIGAQFRRHQYDEDFRSRFWFAPRALAIPPWFVLAEASTPGWRGAASGQDHCSAGDPVTGAFAPGRERDLSGSQAIHPVPLLRSATPAEPTIPHPWRVSSGLPLLHRQQRLQRAIDIGATAGFGTCSLCFTSGVAITHARLASDRLASPCGEGVEPSGSR
jgi:hypothetical protein